MSAKRLVAIIFSVVFGLAALGILFKTPLSNMSLESLLALLGMYFCLRDAV